MWRIGGSEKDEVVFGYVRDVAVDSKGIVYAADYQHSSVYAFSSAGALVSEIGRKGEGPGEFDQPSSLSIGAGDTLFVLDYNPRRVSVFAPDSYEFIESIEVRNWQRKRPSELIGVTPAVFILSFQAPFGTAGDNQEPRRPDVRLVDRRRGALLDQPPLGRMSSTAYIVHEYKGGVTAGVMPFRGIPKFRMSLNGWVYLASGDESEVAVRSIDGAVQDTIRWAHDPIPVTSRDVSDELKSYSRRWRKLVQDKGIPKTKPAFQQFVVDDQERVWIQTSAAHGATTTAYVILNAEGGRVASIEMPKNLRLDVVRGSRAYGVMKVDDGAQVLIAYAIN